MGDKYKPNLERNKILLPVMTHISKTLEGLYKHYWLAGGTLLGKLNFIIFLTNHYTKILF